MRLRTIASVLVLMLLAGCLASAKDSGAKKREKARKMAASTLEDLYKLQPASKELIRNAPGYAVFNNMGTNLFLLSTARGAGNESASRAGRTVLAMAALPFPSPPFADDVVLLRPWRESDVPAQLTAFRDRMFRHFSDWQPHTEAHARRQLEESERARQRGERVSLAWS